MGESQTLILRNGDVATIQKVSVADARDVLAFFKLVRNETTFSSFQPAEIEKTTLEEEQAHLSRFDTPSNGVMLKAVVDGRVAGLASCGREPRERLRHAGVLGLNVLQEHWTLGLGRALATATISEAKAIGVSRIELSKFGPALCMMEPWRWVYSTRALRPQKLQRRGKCWASAANSQCVICGARRISGCDRTPLRPPCLNTVWCS